MRSAEPLPNSTRDLVERYLAQYRSDERYSRRDVKNYTIYKRVLEAFREHYRLTDYSFRQFDKFLWLLGKDHFERSS